MNDMKWIPVTERLPEGTGKYLVTIRYNSGEVGVSTNMMYFDGANEYEFYFNKKPSGAAWCFYNEYEEVEGEALCCTILAWMPYPEPYDPNN